MLSLGEYPAVSLAEARELRAAMRKRLNAGENPAAARRAAKHAKPTAARNTFESVAIEWIEKQEGRWTLHHALDVQRSLVKEAFPAIETGRSARSSRRKYFAASRPSNNAARWKWRIARRSASLPYFATPY